MSTPSVNINLSLPIVMGSQDEVWGHDSQDFYEGSDPLVCVVKRSGIYPKADLMFRLTYLTALGRAFSSIPHPLYLNFLLRYYVFA